MKRTFIAVKTKLSTDTLDIFLEIKTKLKNSHINWVDAGNMHITLFFLGNTPEDQIPEICKQIKEKLRNNKRILFSLKGLGVFKNIHDPRVIWFGIENEANLKLCKSGIDNVLIKLGFKAEDRAFKPHLTLGRIKYLKQNDLLRELIEKFNEFYFLDISVDEVIFYESILTPEGPFYKEIDAFKLA